MGDRRVDVGARRPPPPAAGGTPPATAPPASRLATCPVISLLQADRVLADLAVKRHRGIQRRLRRGCAADDLDQRDQMRRVERVAEHDALWDAGNRILYAADLEGGGGGGEHRAGAGVAAPPSRRTSVLLVGQALGPGFLHEIGAFQRRRDGRVASTPQPAPVGAGSKADRRHASARCPATDGVQGSPPHRAPGRRRSRPAPAARNVARPARADDTRADDGDARAPAFRQPCSQRCWQAEDAACLGGAGDLAYSVP